MFGFHSSCQCLDFSSEIFPFFGTINMFRVARNSSVSIVFKKLLCPQNINVVTILISLNLFKYSSSVKMRTGNELCNNWDPSIYATNFGVSDKKKPVCCNSRIRSCRASFSGRRLPRVTRNCIRLVLDVSSWYAFRTKIESPEYCLRTLSMSFQFYPASGLRLLMMFCYFTLHLFGKNKIFALAFTYVSTFDWHE